MSEWTAETGYQEALRRIKACRMKGNKGTSLSLRELSLTSLPPEIGLLTSLRALHLLGNLLRSLPSEIGQLSTLTSLDLRENQLASLPTEIGQLVALTKLDLLGNQLESLPPEIGQLSTLKELDLGLNQLTSLPPGISQLSSLRELNLKDNHLSQLPPEIGQLSALKELNLSQNRLMSLPPEIGQLAALTGLYLWDNQLASLPPEIGQLAALSVLELQANKLTSLPPEIGQLAGLKELDVWGNLLTSLPPELRRLGNLSRLFLHDNPRLGLNDEALGPTDADVSLALQIPKPPKEILAIYFAQQSSGTKALNEVKIILVGRGGAGKTSIRRRLIEDRFDAEQKETPGIEIDHWELERKQDGITAHLWDFAGQDITHATHQFFLTRRSLYLLVLEGRSDSQDRDAEYWLRLIRAFGADSPVIVVLNKWDEKPFAVADFTLRQEFPHIRAFIRTDCRTGLGLLELKQTIRETAAAMETVKQAFPKLWFSVKEEMAEMKENYLPLCRYREICQKHGVTAENDQNALAGYLHDLGIILHYAEDARLSDTTVLNPRWVTASVYTLLRLVEKRQTGEGNFTGHLTLDEARRALAGTDLKMVEYLIGLMDRFELCYPLEGQKDTWLIPQLLAPQTPQNLGDKWFKEKATRLRYRYNVLPEGLLPRFIVRAHPLISENLVWRQGVVLEMEDEASGETARALVIAEPGKERIQVTVIGATAARLRLTKLVRSHFRDIHEDFDRRVGTRGKTVNNLNARELIELEDKPGLFESVKALIVDEKNGKPSSISTDEEGSIRINQKQELDRVAAPDGKERRNTAREIFEDRHKVFLSYSHVDSAYRDVFMQNLKVMEADGLIDSWYDGKVLAGENFDGKIRNALEEADVILFLVSTASLGSKYIQEVELSRALERIRKAVVLYPPKVIPILLEENCAWKGDVPGRDRKLDHLQILPGDRNGNIKAVDQWPSRRKAFNAVEQSLRKLLAQAKKP